jgi:hypothetical protein
MVYTMGEQSLNNLIAQVMPPKYGTPNEIIINILAIKKKKMRK